MSNPRTWAASLATPILLLTVGCSSSGLAFRQMPTGATGVDPQISVDRLMSAAETFERQGNPDKAKQLYASVLSRNPKHVAATEKLERIVVAEHRRTLGSQEPQVAQEPLPKKPVAAVPSLMEPQSRPAQAGVETPSEEQWANLTEQAPELSNAKFQAPIMRPQGKSDSARTNPAIKTVVLDGAAPPASQSNLEINSAQMRTRVQRLSLTALCAGAPENLLESVRRLESDVAADRKDAAAHLGLLGHEAQAALPAIREVLRDEDPLVRAQAATAVWQISRQPAAAVSVLIGLLDNPNPAVRTLAAYQLGAIGPEASMALPALGRSLEKCDPVARVHIAEAMVRIDPTHHQSIAILVAALHHPDSDVHTLAAFALTCVAPQDSNPVVEELSAALRGPDVRLQSAAALSLGSFGAAAESAIPDLVRLMDSADPYVREAASISLACIKAAMQPAGQGKPVAS
jgi:HEAT repeat protein